MTNYRQAIEQAEAYIETHIQQPLTLEQIATQIGYSPFHFSRVFLAYHGATVMDYVRKRRLSLASQEINQGEKVLDAALKYGFETASGFSKAFRRQYQVAPSQYEPKFTLEFLNVQIVEREPFNVAGYSAQMEATVELAAQNLAGYWYDLNENATYWEERLYEELNPLKHGEVGLFVPGEDAQIRYVLGVIVPDFSQATPDMERFQIPGGSFAVFTAPPANMTEDPENLTRATKELWKFIYGQWFQDSDYIYDEDRFDFEYYDERAHYRADAVMEIWVPIKTPQSRNSAASQPSV